VPQDIEQGSKKKWLMFLILAPGIFFVFYWFFFVYDKPAAEKREIPQTAVKLGELVLLDGHGYRVFQGDKLFSDRVQLQHNLVIAEPGLVFAGLGVAADGDGWQGTVTVIDSFGRVYVPLKVEQALVARTFGFAADGKVKLFMFKLDASADSYFLQLSGYGQAWKFANTYRNP